MNFLRTIRPLVWLVLALALAVPRAPAAPATAAPAACVTEAAAENRACCAHCACEAKPSTKTESPSPSPAAPAPQGERTGPMAPPAETMLEIPAPERTPAAEERLERTSDSAETRDVRVPLYRRHCAFLI